MSGEEPIVMSPEQLWAPYDEENEKYRGEPVEITDFEHKMAKDMRDLAKNFNNIKNDNEVRVYSNKNEQYDNEDEFFDYVRVTYPNPK